VRLGGGGKKEKKKNCGWCSFATKGDVKGESGEPFFFQKKQNKIKEKKKRKNSIEGATQNPFSRLQQMVPKDGVNRRKDGTVSPPPGQ